MIPNCESILDWRVIHCSAEERHTEAACAGASRDDHPRPTSTTTDGGARLSVIPYTLINNRNRVCNVKTMDQHKSLQLSSQEDMESQEIESPRPASAKRESNRRMHALVLSLLIVIVGLCVALAFLAVRVRNVESALGMTTDETNATTNETNNVWKRMIGLVMPWPCLQMVES